jgi:hypothetical protein
MKKLFNVLGIIAASAIAFTACQEASVEAPVTPNLVTVTFTAQTPGTKLAATEGETAASYKWTDEDAANMRLYTVSGTTVTAVANPTVTKVSDTELSISAQVAGNAEYTFRAVLAGAWTSTGKSCRVSDTQNPSETGFDPEAVILFSEDKTVSVGEPSDPTSANASTGALDLTFNRLTVVNKMTLKGLVEGEKIESVVITSQDKGIVGYIGLSDKKSTADKSVLTVNYKSAPAVPANGQFDVYFTTLPAENLSLKVDVTTDQNTYTKTIGGNNKINFVQGQYTRFGVAMPAGTPIGGGPIVADYYYVKVTSTSEVTDGDYLIVYEDGPVAFNGGLATLDAANNGISVTIADNKIAATDDVNAAKFTIDTSAGTIKSASGFYIGVGSYSNGLKQNANATTYTGHSFAISGGNAEISLSNTSWEGKMILNYNSNSNDKRFRYYKGGSQKSIQLYKYNGPVIETVAMPTFSPVAGEVESGTTITISTTTDGASIYYTLDGTEPTTSSTLYSAPIEITADVTIKAIAVKDGMNNSSVASAEYTVGVVVTELTTITQTTSWGDSYFGEAKAKYGSNGLASDLIYGNLKYWAGTGSKVKFSTNSNRNMVQLGGSGKPGESVSIQLKVGGSGTLSIEARSSGDATTRMLYVANGTTKVNDGNAVPSSTGTITNFDYPVTASDGDFINIYCSASINIYSITWTPSSAVVNNHGKVADDPFSIAEVKEYIDGLNGSASTENVYVRGIVTSVVFDFSAQYGTATFWIGDTLDANDLFEAYSIYPSTNQSWTAGDGSVNVNDEVILCGKVTKYQSTYETSSKNAYIYTWNHAAVAPVFSVDGGSVQSGTSVEISSSTTGADIYYTTDGTVPTTASAKYTTAITITDNVTIKAIAVADGFRNSVVSTAVYTISAASTATETFVFADYGYANAADLTTVDGTVFTLSFAVGSNSSGNSPKYYTTGSGARMYFGNTLTISGQKTITGIEFTYSGTTYYAGFSANLGSMSGDDGSSTKAVWSGSSNSVVLTSSRTCRIQKIVITYNK